MSNRKHTEQTSVDEHDTLGGVDAKKVLVYGWDGDNMVKVRLNVSSDGSLVLDDYNISDIDDTTDTHYFGWLNSVGAWRIMRMVDGVARYASGSTDYETNWTNRASLTYGYYNALFET